MFSETTLTQFHLTTKNLHQTGEHTLWVKKWDWDYSRAHAFQKYCVESLAQHPRLKILIVCSHPRVFTNGRGLQKARKGQTLNLVDFNPNDAQSLPFPFHQIERGGGLTFHHPGQFVFYPILKLNPERLSLSSMIDDVFSATMSVLGGWGISDLSTENILMGLWHGQKKLASLGIAIQRMTTFHGMALNIYRDLVMEAALRKMNPCGISAETYTSVEDLMELPENAMEKFADLFIERINHAWK